MILLAYWFYPVSFGFMYVHVYPGRYAYEYIYFYTSMKRLFFHLLDVANYLQQYTVKQGFLHLQ